MKLEFDVYEVRKGTYAIVKNWLAKTSGITDEYYEKIMELDKLVFILNNQIYCADAKAYEDLFVAECLDLDEYRKNKVDYIKNLKEEDLETYRHGVVIWLDTLIVFISKYMSRNDLQSFLDMKTAILHCHPSEIANTLIDLFYDRFVLNNYTLMALKDRNASLTEEQMAYAKHLDVNDEVNKINDSLFGYPKESRQSNYHDTHAEVGKLLFNNQMLDKMDYDITDRADQIATTHMYNMSPDEVHTVHR